MKKLRKVFAVVLTMAIMLSVCVTGISFGISSGAAANYEGKQLLTYFANWGNLSAKDLPWDRLTYINHAFFEILPKGTNTYEIASTNAEKDYLVFFPEYEEMNKIYPDVNIMISVGGWTRSGRFSEMANTAAGRASFIASCVAFLKQYPFLGGIDLDWEYPGVYRAPDSPIDPPEYGNLVVGNDYVNYTLLLKELNAALKNTTDFPKGKKLTVCSSVNPEVLAKQDVKAVSENVDLVNVMTYDMTGSYDPVTGHQSALYNYGTEKERLQGGNRVETAVAIAKNGWETADTVVLASGANFADALAGGSLAKAYDAPILLSQSKTILEPAVKDEIISLEATKVIILGGSSSVAESVENEIAAIDGVEVERIFGGNRYETAVEIAKALDTELEGFTEVYVANGQDFPDALAISPVAALKGAPVLFTNAKVATLHATTKDYLKDKTLEKATAVGGESSVGAGALSELAALATATDRLAGSNRYFTAEAIYKANSDLFAGEAVTLATGASFPDALTGSALAAKLAAPLFLLHPATTTGFDALVTDIADIAPDTAYVFGGGSTLSDEIVEHYLPKAKHSVERGISYQLAEGVDPAKIMIGSPFYGHAWTDVDVTADNVVGQAGKGGSANESKTYKELKAFEDAAVPAGTPGWHYGYDATAAAAYLYNDDPSSPYNGEFISYDSKESIAAKIDYINDLGLAGCIVWEANGDVSTKNFPLLTELSVGLDIYGIPDPLYKTEAGYGASYFPEASYIYYNNAVYTSKSDAASDYVDFLPDGASGAALWNKEYDVVEYPYYSENGWATIGAIGTYVLYNPDHDGTATLYKLLFDGDAAGNSVGNEPGGAWDNGAMYEYITTVILDSTVAEPKIPDPILETVVGTGSNSFAPASFIYYKDAIYLVTSPDANDSAAKLPDGDASLYEKKFDLVEYTPGLGEIAYPADSYLFFDPDNDNVGKIYKAKIPSNNWKDNLPDGSGNEDDAIWEYITTAVKAAGAKLPDPLTETLPAYGDNTFVAGAYIYIQYLDAQNQPVSAIFKATKAVDDFKDNLPGGKWGGDSWVKEFDVKDYVSQDDKGYWDWAADAGDYIFYDPDKDGTGAIYLANQQMSNTLADSPTNLAEPYWTYITTLIKLSGIPEPEEPYECAFPEGTVVTAEALEANENYWGVWQDHDFTVDGVEYNKYPKGAIVKEGNNYYESHNGGDAWTGHNPSGNQCDENGVTISGNGKWHLILEGAPAPEIVLTLSDPSYEPVAGLGYTLYPIGTQIYYKGAVYESINNASSDWPANLPDGDAAGICWVKVVDVTEYPYNTGSWAGIGPKGTFFFYDPDHDGDGVLYKTIYATDPGNSVGNEPGGAWDNGTLYERIVRLVKASGGNVTPPTPEYTPKYASGATEATLLADPLFKGVWTSDNIAAGFDTYPEGTIVTYLGDYYEGYKANSVWTGWDPVSLPNNWKKITLITSGGGSSLEDLLVFGGTITVNGTTGTYAGSNTGFDGILTSYGTGDDEKTILAGGWDQWDPYLAAMGALAGYDPQPYGPGILFKQGAIIIWNGHFYIDNDTSGDWSWSWSPTSAGNWRWTDLGAVDTAVVS
ncbi:MAG: cell wall-binding repeat-containing protein [Oscillospiraceae bacterium]|nr:cell wall-binding repeat-containing protein [Oscillospiraceae bacterium]